MNSNRNYPYSADELREIADHVDAIVEALGGGDLPDGDWRWGVTVEVWHEDTLVGHVKPHGDAWLGFYPKAVAE